MCVNKDQHNTLYNSYAQIKTSIKRDSVTLATKHTTSTTIFKYMPPTTLTSQIKGINTIDRHHTYKEYNNKRQQNLEMDLFICQCHC